MLSSMGNDDDDDDYPSVFEEEEEEEEEQEGEGESEVVEAPGAHEASKLISDLKTCLDDCTHDGAFSSFHTFHLYVNPGLDLKDYGAVGLPLTPRDASAIARTCKQSPFGKGDETLIDTSVRRTWELDASEFTCRNPQWEHFIGGLTEQSLKNLGVKFGCHAQAYKLLLYEEGAFFKAHKDTEKVPGMFGTLVVCLPSEHAGGEVRLVHNGSERILETAPGSPHDLSALAWYSDVSHEVRPVTSGYRLVLTYNLVQDATVPMQSATLLDASHGRLERILQYWSMHHPGIEQLIYPLQHKYTSASLSLRNLKGEDAAKGHYVDRICARNGLFWFLGQLDKVDYADEDYGGYYDDSDREEKLSLSEIKLPSGVDFALTCDVSPGDILVQEDDLYGERDPDSEDEGEFTGNESMPGPSRYHDTVLILIRKEVLIERCPTDFHFEDQSQFWELFYDNLKAFPGEESLSMMCSINKIIMASAAKALSKQRNRTNCYGGYTYLDRDADNIFQRISAHCHELGRSADVQSAITTVMRDPKWALSKPLVEVVAGLIHRETATTNATNAAEVWSRWLFESTPTIKTFKEAREWQVSLKIIKGMVPQEQHAFFDSWVSSQIFSLLKTIKSYSMMDTNFIAELAGSLSHEEFMEAVLPTLAKCSDRNAPLTLLLMLKVERTKSPDTTGLDVVLKATFRSVLSRDGSISVPNLAEPPPPPQNGYYHYPQADKPHISEKEFFDVLDCAMKLGLKDEATSLLIRALPKRPAPNSDRWIEWKKFISELYLLTDGLSAHYISLQEALRPLILYTLRGSCDYLQRMRPAEPNGWSQPQHHCTGSPEPQACMTLDAFLVNPTQSQASFRAIAAVRTHLEKCLDATQWPYGPDFKFTTNKQGGSPYTLIIEKTHNRYARAQAQMKDDLEYLEQHVKGLKDSPNSSRLLGDQLGELDEILHRIQNLRSPSPHSQPTEPLLNGPLDMQAPAPQRHLPPPQPSYPPTYTLPTHPSPYALPRQPLHPTHPSAQNTLPPIDCGERPSKRQKVEVVDLTGGGGSDEEEE